MRFSIYDPFPKHFDGAKVTRLQALHKGILQRLKGVLSDEETSFSFAETYLYALAIEFQFRAMEFAMSASIPANATGKALDLWESELGFTKITSLSEEDRRNRIVAKWRNVDTTIAYLEKVAQAIFENHFSGIIQDHSNYYCEWQPDPEGISDWYSSSYMLIFNVNEGGNLTNKRFLELKEVLARILDEIIPAYCDFAISKGVFKIGYPHIGIAGLA